MLVHHGTPSIRDEDALVGAIAKQQRRKVIVSRFVSIRKLIAEHRRTAAGLLSRGLVLDDVPVLREKKQAVSQAKGWTARPGLLGEAEKVAIEPAVFAEASDGHGHA